MCWVVREEVWSSALLCFQQMLVITETWDENSPFSSIHPSQCRPHYTSLWTWLMFCYFSPVPFFPLSLIFVFFILLFLCFKELIEFILCTCFDCIQRGIDKRGLIWWNFLINFSLVRQMWVISHSLCCSGFWQYSGNISKQRHEKNYIFI